MKLINKKIKKSKKGCYKVIILLLLFMITIPPSAYGDECPPGEYFVNAFNRTSYYKSNGTFVSSANVDAHCRKYEFNKPLKITFLNKMPAGWPYQLELFRDWSKQEKIEIEKAIKELPKNLQNLGELKLYRAIKSTFPDNPSTSGPDEDFANNIEHLIFNLGNRKVITSSIMECLNTILGNKK